MEKRIKIKLPWKIFDLTRTGSSRLEVGSLCHLSASWGAQPFRAGDCELLSHNKDLAVDRRWNMSTKSLSSAVDFRYLQITSAFCSEPLEIPNAGMRGSLEDLAVMLRTNTLNTTPKNHGCNFEANPDSASRSAPRPIVTADVRITTMSNFAPAANCPHQHAWGNYAPVNS